MATIAFPVQEPAGGGQALLLDAHVETFLDEVFASEAEFEEALVPRLPEFAKLLGVEKLMLIGRQVNLKGNNQSGRGLTLDLYAISEAGHRYVVELKIAQDKYSVAQAYTYAAQLRNEEPEDTCAVYANYLSKTSGKHVTTDEAAEKLAEFLNIEVDDLAETAISDDPAIVIITPSVSAEEYATAKALEEDGNVIAIVCPSVQVTKHGKTVVFERFYPALEPVSDSKSARTARRARSRAEISDAVAHPRKVDTETLILEYLAGLEAGSDGVTSVDLRTATGSKTEFTDAARNLADNGLIERVPGESDKPGRKPLLNRITEDGLAALKLRLEGEEVAEESRGE